MYGTTLFLILIISSKSYGQFGRIGQPLEVVRINLCIAALEEDVNIDLGILVGSNSVSKNAIGSSDAIGTKLERTILVKNNPPVPALHQKTKRRVDVRCGSKVRRITVSRFRLDRSDLQVGEVLAAGTDIENILLSKALGNGLIGRTCSANSVCSMFRTEFHRPQYCRNPS